MKHILITALLALTGCQATISSPRTGLWVNREERCSDCNDWSLKVRMGAFERFVQELFKRKIIKFENGAYRAV